MGIDFDNVRSERLPSGDDQHFGWTIRRAQPGGALLLHCISRDIFGVRTHYYRGRTGPCLRTGCEACSRQQLSRWNGYLLCRDTKDGANIVFEFTPPAAMQLDEFFRQYGSLRGLRLIANRTANRANAKVTIACKGTMENPASLPSELQVWPILSHIWGLNREAPVEYSEFSAENLAELERVQLVLKKVGPADENHWMAARAADLAGQLVLPLDPAKNLNGKR